MTPKQPKCKTCDDKGKYHKFEDRDIYEGYKLAPLYYCSCSVGQERERTQHVHLEENKILHIHADNKTYRFENGKVKIIK